MVLALPVPALILLAAAGWFLNRGRRRLSTGRTFARGATITDAEIVDLRPRTR